MNMLNIQYVIEVIIRDVTLEQRVDFHGSLQFISSTSCAGLDIFVLIFYLFCYEIVSIDFQFASYSK